MLHVYVSGPGTACPAEAVSDGSACGVCATRASLELPWIARLALLPSPYLRIEKDTIRANSTTQCADGTFKLCTVLKEDLVLLFAPYLSS